MASNSMVCYHVSIHSTVSKFVCSCITVVIRCMMHKYGESFLPFSDFCSNLYAIPQYIVVHFPGKCGHDIRVMPRSLLSYLLNCLFSTRGGSSSFQVLWPESRCGLGCGHFMENYTNCSCYRKSVNIPILAIVQYSYTQKVLTVMSIQINDQLLPKA